MISKFSALIFETYFNIPQHRFCFATVINMAFGLSYDHFSLNREANSDVCGCQEDSIYLIKILTLSIAKTYLQTGDTLIFSKILMRPKVPLYFNQKT